MSKKTRGLFPLPKDYSEFIPTATLLHNATIGRELDTLECLFENRAVTAKMIQATAETLFMDDYRYLRSQFCIYCDTYGIEFSFGFGQPKSR